MICQDLKDKSERKKSKLIKLKELDSKRINSKITSTNLRRKKLNLPDAKLKSKKSRDNVRLWKEHWS